MDLANELPNRLIDCQRLVADPDACVDLVARMRWGESPRCPSCDGAEHSFLSTRLLWKCRRCSRQFSVRVGTIFERSPIGLDRWVIALWLICNTPPMSSRELSRAMGLTQRTALSVLKRARAAIEAGSLEGIGPAG